MAVGVFSRSLQLAQTMLLLLLLACLSPSAAGGVVQTIPRFIEPVTNFTAAVTKTAQLTCRVHNLTKYTVAWFHMDRQMLLTIHNNVVTRIPRFSVTREDNTTWTLNIDPVMAEDKGSYMCQVNTEPMISQKGYLNVVVPPVIVDEGSSASSVVVQENGNVTLTCQAEGNPEPRISWVREDKKQITLGKRKKAPKYEGSTLKLEKVSRRDMGAYLCIANNSIPPAVSKRIELKVHFSPIVLLPNQLMSAPRGSSVWLECRTEAYPRAVTFWKHNHTMVMSTNKYKLEEFHHDDYTTTVKLTIKHLEPRDFGDYLCYSRNSFGENDGTVELHELPPIPKKIKNGEDVDSNIIEQYPPERETNRGQNHVIAMDDKDHLQQGNINRNQHLSNHNNEVTQGGIEHTSQLGRERGRNVFSNSINNTAGVRSSPSTHVLVFCVIIALSSIQQQLCIIR